MDVLQDTDVTTHNDFTTKSRNYKLGVAHESMQAAIQGNTIFDPSSQLPREVMLETTLKAFGFSMDLWEVCNIVGQNSQCLLTVIIICCLGQPYPSTIKIKDIQNCLA